MSVYVIGASIKGIYYSGDIWELARYLHIQYEILKDIELITRKQRQVIFEDLPLENKVHLLELAGRILTRMNLILEGAYYEEEVHLQ